MISILLFLMIIFSACFLAATYGKHVKDIFPISCMGTIVILFILGIVSNLNIAFYCVCLLSWVFLVWGAYNCLRKDVLNRTRASFFNKTMFPIWAALLFFLWCDIGMRGGVHLTILRIGYMS